MIFFHIIICEGTVAQIKYQLMCAEISKKNDSEAKLSLDTALKSIDYDAIRNDQDKKFHDVLERKEYSEVIRVFNCKNISKSIGHFFGIDNKEYCRLVLALLKDQKHDEIIGALQKYIPTDIPR